MEFEIRDGKAALIDDEGNDVSWVVFEIDGDSIHLIETHTARGFEGKGYAGNVVGKVMEYSEGFKKIMVSCPYIKHWLRKNSYESEKIKFTELLKLKESIDFFNKYHEPEAKAEYRKYRDGIAEIHFSGYMCRTCGVYDYFEDIIQDVDAKIIDYTEDDEGFMVKYRLMRMS